ncbi:mannitol-1-phosphate 5-dehydrogenase [Dentipellis sp. KUC8613]|nr:mannitol-1-phosphate 5-dehydrogenase [Dentipellis sp. KUC8613]
MSNPRAVHLGAGNVGRGFIGALLSESGYHVVFSDVNEELIKEFNQRSAYDLHVLDENARTKRISISDISGVLSTSDDIIREIAHPDTRLVTTAVGPSILEKIAPTLARGLTARHEAGAGPLNIIACENMVHQTTKLSEHVRAHLPPDGPARTWVAQHVGFADCSVDRIVPPAGQSRENPLDVGVEGFFEWAVDRHGLAAAIAPPVKGMELTDDLPAYIERKLFTLNCGHAIIAYLGFLRGYGTIDRAIHDTEIRDVVRRALLEEGGAALIQKYGWDPAEYEKYVSKVMHRFANPQLRDDVKRVGRQPLRKLGQGDRLLGPLKMAKESGLPYDNLAKGVAAAFHFDVDDDEQSREMQEKVKGAGIERAIAEVCEFEDGCEEQRKVVDAYNLLRKFKVDVE